MINVFRTPDKDGRQAIAVVLSQDAMFVTTIFACAFHRQREAAEG
jgi:hypothetical protein